MEDQIKCDISRLDAHDFSPDGPWRDLAIRRKEGVASSVKGYHKHSYYEMNLILSGSARILTAEGSHDGERGTLIISAPGAPHYVKRDGLSNCKRVYLLFSEELVSDRSAELNSVFSLIENNCITLRLSEYEINLYLDTVRRIEQETRLLPAKMLIFYLLSVLATRAEENAVRGGERVPEYVLGSMTYIEEHLDERLSADVLAKKFHVGRTTLMTGFKAYAKLTVGEYIDIRRLERAASLLRSGETVEYAALRCGFSDAGGLIRLFKRNYGVSPLKYIRKISK